jgi:hypothetical protein
MKQHLLIVGVLGMFLATAFAQPTRINDPLPPEVARVRDAAIADCRQSGGRPSIKPGYIQTADFNGDGRPDYVVDAGEMICAGASPLECGTGGCSIEVYISTPTGYRSANLQRLGFDATIERGAGAPLLAVGGRRGTIRYRWNGNAFQAVQGR